MEEVKVAGDREAKTGEVSREGEVEVVVVKAVEGGGVEADFVEHRAPRGDEQAIERTNAADDGRGRAEHMKRVLLFGAAAVRDLTKNIRRPGEAPFGAD